MWRLWPAEVALLIGVVVARYYHSSEIETQFLLGTTAAFYTVYAVICFVDLVFLILRRLAVYEAPLYLNVVSRSLKLGSWLFFIFGLRALLWTYARAVPIEAWSWWGTILIEDTLGILLLVAMIQSVRPLTKSRAWFPVFNLGKRRGFAIVSQDAEAPLLEEIDDIDGLDGSIPLEHFQAHS